LRLCAVLQALKNAVTMVMQTENFETKILDDKFKHSIKILITNNDKKFDVVDLKTTQQAKLLLDFFNNNRFIPAGLNREHCQRYN
jgi:hypothetical protein